MSTTAARLQRYYDESLPASALPATGASAGAPGSWTPSGSMVPASPAALAAGVPNVVAASPATAWTSGEYVQTATAGLPGRASWSGTAWVGGAAPLAAEPVGGDEMSDTPTPEVEPEPEQAPEPEPTEPEPEEATGT